MTAIPSSFNVSAGAIADELDRSGFVCIEDAVTPEWLERARSHVRTLLAAHGERFFSVLRPADEAGSPADEVAHDPNIQQLLRDVTARIYPEGLAEFEDVYNVLRIVAGPKTESGSLEFHYDASVVTVLVPIFMPDAGSMRSGELVTFPNQRPFRKSVGVNLVEKALVQNRWFRRRAIRRFRKSPDTFMRVLRPGNIYLFWGYRTFHGNLACEPHTLRATLLLHYGNPHGNSLALRTIRFGRRVVEKIRLKLG